MPEDGPKEEHVIVFYDPQGIRMPGARCRVYEAGRLLTPDPTSADGAGELRVELRDSTSTVRVERAPPNLPPHDFLPYRKIYNVKMSDEEGDVGLDRRLSNLGFALGRRREDNVSDYERAYGREPTGNPNAIRLEVLERHDDGAVQVFHPHEAQGDAPTNSSANRSFFGSPPPQEPSWLRPDRQGGGGGAGGAGKKTTAGQNVKGSAVPDASNLLLMVGLESDFPVLDPKKVKLRVRPLKVPGMTADKMNQGVKPVADGTPVPKAQINGVTRPAHLLYGFKDLPIGTYTAVATMDSAPTAPGAAPTGASGKTEVTLKMGLLTIGYVGMKRAFAAICQDMKRSGATVDPNLHYRLAHVWAEKWTEANKGGREFLAVAPAAATADAMNKANIDALATRKLVAFEDVCQRAHGGTVFMALSHGGVELTDGDKKALPGRQAQLQKDKDALKQEREDLSNLKRTLAKDSPDPGQKKDIEAKEKWIKEQQARLNVEDARVSRTLFPTFSLGSQRGGLHAQYLAIDYEYFIFLDNPNGGWTDKEKKAYEARKAYLAALKKIFQEHKIKTLHLIACNIGQDDTFVGRVAKELGVGILAYQHFTNIKLATGFIGLSSDKKTDDIVKATSVEPPMEPATVKP